MKKNITTAALAAFLLSGLLIGCGGGGAEETVVGTDVAVTTVAEVEPTKPPPVISASTSTPGSAGEEVVVSEPEGDSGDAPALPTAIPTVAPTVAPPTATPTQTPVPTAVPPTAVPVVVQPTAVPPTATAVPPTPVPQLGANGITATHFAIQDRASLTPGGKVWFEFNVVNSSGGDVVYDTLGVMPKKDGVDRPEWYQNSYGGTMTPDGLNWEDHIKLPETGDYTLRLVICFDGSACRENKGTWHTLSPEIPVAIR